MRRASIVLLSLGAAVALAETADALTSNVTASSTPVVANGTATVQIVVAAYKNGVLEPNATFTLATTRGTLAVTHGTTGSSGTYSTTLTSTTSGTAKITGTVGGVTVSPATATFIAGPPSSAQSKIVASPTSLRANGTTTTTLTVTLRDAEGNLVPSTQVNLTAPTGATLTPTTGHTGSAGTLTATLSMTPTSATSVTVNATSGAATFGAQVTLVADPPSTTVSTFTASSSSIVANGTTATTLTLTARDAGGILIRGEPVTFSVTGSSNTLSTTTGTTNASGQVAITLKSTKAEAKNVYATMGSVSVQRSVTFVHGPAVASTSSIVRSPQAVPDNGTTTTTLTVTFLDAFDNPVPSLSVKLSGPSGTALTPTTGVTKSNGTMTATLAVVPTEAASVTITAAAGSVKVTQPVSITADPPSSMSSKLSASLTSLVVNRPTTLTLTATDANGVRIHDQSVAFSSTGSANTFTPASGSTNASGQLTATLKSTKAETKIVTATMSGVPITIQVTFLPGAPASAKSKLVAPTSSVVADGQTPATITVTIADAYGNGVPNQTVTWSVAPTTGRSIAPAAQKTDANGQVVAVVTSTVAGTATVSAVSGSIHLSGHAIFIAGLPSPAESSVTVNPNGVPADGVSKTAVSVTVKDAFGNVVTGMPIALSVSPTTATVATSSGTTSSAGKFSTTMTATAVGTYTITATVEQVPILGTATFDDGLPALLESSVVATPNVLFADGVSASTITVSVRDANGVALPQVTVRLSVSGTGATLSPTTGTTDQNGIVTAKVVAKTAGNRTVSATVGSFTTGAEVIFWAPGTVPGAPTDVAAESLNASAVVSWPAPSPGSSPLTEYMVTPWVGNVAGVATRTTGTTVTVANLVNGTTYTFTVSAENASGIGPASLATNAVTPGTPRPPAQISVTPGLYNATVTWTAAQPEGAPLSGYIVTPYLGSTPDTADAVTVDGQTTTAFLTNLLGSTSYRLTVVPMSEYGDGPAATSAPVTVLGVPTAASLLVVSGNDQIGTVGAPLAAPFVVQMIDPLGAPVSSAVVTWTVSSGPGGPGYSGSMTTVTASDGTTYITSVLGTLVGTDTFTATSGSTSVTFTATAVAGLATSLAVQSGNNQSVAPGGTVSDPLVVIATDAFGNPVSGVTVTWATGTCSGSGCLVENPSTETDGAGTAATAVAVGGTTGPNQYVASAPGLTGSPVPFTALGTSGTPSGATIANDYSSLTVSYPLGGESATADDVSYALLTIQAEDSNGNPISSAAVTFTSTGSANTFTPVTGTALNGDGQPLTDGSGNLNVEMTSTTAEIKTVTATVTNGTWSVDLSGSVEFDPGPPTSNSLMTITAGTVTANGLEPAEVNLTAIDAYGNLVPQRYISLCWDQPGYVPYGLDTGYYTDENGVLTSNDVTEGVPVYFTIAEAGNVLAIDGYCPGTSFQQASLSFVSGPSAQYPWSTLTVDPSGPITADGVTAATLTLEIDDDNDNPIVGQTVTLTVTGSNSTLSSGSMITTDGTIVGTTTLYVDSGNVSHGQFQVVLTSTTAETKTVTATVGDAQLTQQIVFQPGPPDWSASSMVITPNNTPLWSDNSASATITVTVKDSSGNPISDYWIYTDAFDANGYEVDGQVTIDNNGSFGFNAPTDANGVVQFLAYSEIPGTITIEAGPAWQYDLSGTATFVAGPPDPQPPTSGNYWTTLHLAYPSPVTYELPAGYDYVPADGATYGTLTLTLTDEYENRMPNQSVTVTSTGSRNTLLAPAEATLTQVSAGDSVVLSGVTFQAVASGATGNQFDVGSSDTATAGNLAAAINGSTSPGISGVMTATTSTNGNPWPWGPVVVVTTSGAPVTWGACSASFTVTAASGSTDDGSLTASTNASGQLIFTLASATPEDKLVTATIGTSQVQQQVVFQSALDPATVASSTLSSLTIAPGGFVSNGTPCVTTNDCNGGNPGTWGGPYCGNAGECLQAPSLGIVPDDSSQGTVTLSLVDDEGNPMPGQQVMLTTPEWDGNNSFQNVPANGGNIAFSDAAADGEIQGTTDANGVLQSWLYACCTDETDYVSVYVLQNYSYVFLFTLDVAFTGSDGAFSVYALPPVQQRASFTASGPVVADGVSTSTLTLCALNANDLPWNNTAISLSATGSGIATYDDGSINASLQFVTTGAHFSSGDVGQIIQISGSAISTNNQRVTITSVNSPYSADVANTDAYPCGGSTCSAQPLQQDSGPLAWQTDSSFCWPNVACGSNTFYDSVTGPYVDSAGYFSTPTLAVAEADSLTPGCFQATLSSATAGVKTVQAIVDSYPNFWVDTQVTFVAGAPATTLAGGGAASNIVISPTTQAADFSSTSLVTVTLEDTYGNPVPNTQVWMYAADIASPPAGPLPPGEWVTHNPAPWVVFSNGVNQDLVGTTDENGQVVFTVMSATPQTATLYAEDGSYNIYAQATMTFSAATSPNIYPSPLTSPVESESGVAVTGGPTFIANGTSAATVTLQLAGLAEVGGMLPLVGVPVTFTCSGSGNTLSMISGTTSLVCSGGGFCWGELATTLTTTVAEAKSVTVTAGSDSWTTSIDFMAGPVDASKSSIVISPSTGVVAQFSQTAVATVTALDAFGNPVQYDDLTGLPVEVEMSASGGNTTWFFTPQSSSPNSYANPDVNGAATFLVFSDMAQTETISATMSDQVSPFASAAITFVGGPPAAVDPGQSDSSVVWVSQDFLPANGMTAVTVNVGLKDPDGNPIPNQPVSLSVVSSNLDTIMPVVETTTAATLAASSGTTDSQGVFSTTMTATQAGTYTIVVQAISLTQVALNPANVTFVDAAPSLTKSNITQSASCSTVVADGDFGGCSLTVYVEDPGGNPLPYQSVTLSGSAGVTFYTATGNTGAYGTSFVTTLSSINPGPQTIVAAIGYGTLGDQSVYPTDSPWTDLPWGTPPTVGTVQTIVTFAAPVASQSTSALYVGSSARADGSATISLTVNTKDADGNPISGQTVVLLPSGSGNGFTPAASGITTGGQFTAYLSSTVVQSETIQAQINGVSGFTLTGNQNAVFVAYLPSAATSTVSVSPDVVATSANAATTGTATATILDASGNPVPNQMVQFSGTGQANYAGGIGSPWIAGDTCTTGGLDGSCPLCYTGTNGQCSVQLGSTTAQTESIAIAVASPAWVPLTGAAQVTFATCGSAASGLAAYYGFDTLSAGIFADLSGNGHTAEATADITTTAGILGNAASFASGTSAITLTDTEGAATLSGARTLCAWVRSSSSPSLGLPVFSGGTTGGDLFGLAGTSAPAGVSATDLYFENGGANSPDSNVAAPTGTWTDACWVFDGSEVYSYVNASPSSPQSVSFVSYDVDAITIGGNTVDTGSTTTAFSGLIDEVGVWSRALSSTEITALHDGGHAAGACEPVLGTPSVAQSSLSPSTPSAVVGTPIGLALTVSDANGAPISDQAVTLSGSGTDMFGAATGVTADDGTFSTTVSSSAAEAGDVITATMGTATVTTTVTFSP